jgi:hypothetical protein
MPITFPIWCRNCAEEMEEVRRLDGVVEWRCACPDGSLISEMFSKAFPGRFEPALPLPFKPDCNLRFSVTSPGVLRNILVTSVHLTPRYAIEKMKEANIGYEVREGRAVFIETHVNTAVGFFKDLREQSHANHKAKTSNENLLIPTVCISGSAK